MPRQAHVCVYRMCSLIEFVIYRYALADPCLAHHSHPLTEEENRERRTKIFAATAVSRQLLCFQTFFLHEFGSLPREAQAQILKSTPVYTVTFHMVYAERVRQGTNLLYKSFVFSLQRVFGVGE